MAIISKSPILDVPRWAEKDKLPKEAMVVTALKTTARAVTLRDVLDG